ncbi:MAG: hypothetical protein ACYTF7_05035 [Planctomycetota bacterium]|jgi:hypothetical protein
MEQLLEKDPALLIPVMAIVLGCGIAFVSIITCTIKGICKTNQVERSRREIAAYIAEGSISPEEGERLMKAGKRHDA